MNDRPLKIFISWIGLTDLKNFMNETPGMQGPLFSILEYYQRRYETNFFDELLLMYAGDSKTADKMKGFTRRASRYAGKCIIEELPQVDPVDPGSIYEAEVDILSKLPKGASLYYGLTSGTPAMYAVQLLMSAGKFSGVPMYTVDPRYRKEGGPRAYRLSLPNLLPGIDPDAAPSGEPFISATNRRVFEQVRTKIARTKASVLIVGETGVGKTQLAQYIHAQSGRSGKAMLSLNCAEVAGDHNMMRSELFGHVKGAFTGATENKKGKFELADGSTLFLDEIGEIPLELQSVLLKALDDGVISPLGDTKVKKVDVRIIAATNRDLLKDVQGGPFPA